MGRLVFVGLGLVYKFHIETFSGNFQLVWGGTACYLERYT